MMRIGINRHRSHKLDMESGIIRCHTVEGVQLDKGRTKDTSHVGTCFRRYEKASMYSSLILE